jgi:hypothetical protein
MFYGRDTLVQEIVKGLAGSARTSFGIAGGRRIGKTTLLRRIELDLHDSYESSLRAGRMLIPIYIDCTVLPQAITDSDVWKFLLLEINGALAAKHTGIIIDIPPKLAFSTFIQLIRTAIERCPERPRFIVLFDEIEPIIVHGWSHGFLSQWRALLHNTPGVTECFVAAFAGAREMSSLQRDVGSPIKNILRWENLCLLDDNSSFKLMQACGISWPEAFLQRAFAETGGHPMLLQYIMQYILDRPIEQAEESLSQAAKKFGKEHRWQLKEWWNRYCTPTAQRVYRRMPHDGSCIARISITHEFGLDEADDALEILQHVGLVSIQEEEERELFRYAGEIFRRWYTSYGAISQAPMHDPDIYERLLAVRASLANKYISAWRMYQSEMPNYSGCVAEMRGVLELLLNDILAPEQEVREAFQERGELIPKRISRHQQVTYVARKHYSNDTSRALISDYSLLETSCEQLATLVTHSYRSSSEMVHGTAQRAQAKAALMQWDSIFAQLLPFV